MILQVLVSMQFPIEILVNKIDWLIPGPLGPNVNNTV